MFQRFRAAVYRGDRRRFEIESVCAEEPRADEVLVRNFSTGICHTDILGMTRLPTPAVFGHEGAGVVEAVGAAVKNVRLGDHVVISYPSCGQCGACHVAQPYNCDRHMQLAFGGMRSDGSATLHTPEGARISSAFFQQSSFAEYSITTQRNIVVIDKDEPLDRVAALACGVQTGAGSVLNTFAMKPGQSLVVFGAGAVGLSAVLAARAAKVSDIIAVDISPRRLELSLELGAKRAIDASQGGVEDAIRSLLPRGADFTLETAGVEESLELAIACLKTGGTCGMVIAPHLGQKYAFSPSSVFSKGACLRGIIQGSAVPQEFIPRLIQLRASGLFPYEKLIKTYPFELINQAVQDLHSGATVKAVLTM